MLLGVFLDYIIYTFLFGYNMFQSILPLCNIQNCAVMNLIIMFLCTVVQYSSSGFSKSPLPGGVDFFSPPWILPIPHSNSLRDGFFAHRVSAEFPPQNHPLACRTPRWAKVYPGELKIRD